jgi:hypothetical protein
MDHQLEDQIKCKVKNKLIKDVLPKYWEIDEWLVYWVNFYSSFVAIYLTHMKYCESDEEIREETEFGTIQIEQVKKHKFKWEKRRKREKEWWKEFWNNLVNCFGEGEISSGEKRIWKLAKKTRWKEIAKQKSIKRGNNHRLQKLHNEYNLDLSDISNEKWKDKWKMEITQRYKKLHPTKEKEIVYKGFNDLQPKVNLKHFEETIKLSDTPTEFMNCSAALQETTSINLRCTGSKDGYESAANFQLSSKNLEYQSKVDLLLKKILLL